MRLDKMLAHSGYGSRKEVKRLIRKGFVYVNDIPILDDDFVVDENQDEVVVEGYQVDYRKYVYLMLNKPPGVVSASFDFHQKTVMDLVDEYDYLHLFPIGRLDKDSEGLMILSNDGELAHALLSPKKHVEKEYYVELKKPLKGNEVQAFLNGIVLEDGSKCLSATLKIKEPTSAYVVLQEGKFHQIKRMFEALDNEVTFLKRIRMNGLLLDENLTSGKYKELSQEELALLKGGNE